MRVMETEVLARPVAPRSAFAADVLEGLTAPRKTLPAKYFYDERGSALFEEITRLPEYYPTRTELRILEENAGEIARLTPPGAALVELGSGSTVKVRVLLGATAGLGAYVPVDVSGTFLHREAAQLRRDFPSLMIAPVVADFTQPFDLPAEARLRRRLGFFPGSTIGNFEPHEAADLLRRIRPVLGRDAVLIMGVDLIKDAATLNAAYDDAAGVTALFNLNLLERINRELGANIEVAAFNHRAFYNERLHRIEMHLVSSRSQSARVCGRTITFAVGESIHTENSYKYSVEGVQALAGQAGWQARAVWTDKDHLFSVHAFTA